MRTVGQILKEVRIQKNLSLQDIAFALKISARTLSALESSDAKELPAKAFVRGFAKSYARYLKIESEELNLAFISEFGDPEGKRAHIEAPAAESETSQSSSGAKPSAPGLRKVDKGETEDELSQLNHEGSKRSVVYFGLGLILVIFIGISKRIIDRYQKELVSNNSEISQNLPENQQNIGNSSGSANPQSALTDASNTPATGSPTTAPTTPSVDSAKNITPPTEASNPATPNPPSTTAAIPSSTNPSGVQNVNTGASANPATPPMEKPKAQEKPNAQVPIATQTASAPATLPTAPARVDNTPYKLKNVEVIVEALGPIEVEYTSKLAAPARIKLNKGQMHVFKSKNGLKLSFNNGGLARLAVNGKDVGNPGQLGKPTVIIY